MTSKQFFAAFVSGALAAAGTAPQAFAQDASPQTAPVSVVLAYDAAHEVSVKGTVEKLVDAQAPDNIPGAHLFVSTAQGTVDAHLGPSASWKAQNLALAPSDAVELTGVIVNFNNKSVLLARTLRMGNRIALLRSEHGIPMRAAGPRTPLAPAAAKGARP